MRSQPTVPTLHRKHQYRPFKGLHFGRQRAAPEPTRGERAERDRLIREFLDAHGVTKLPPGYSHMDL